MEWALVFSHWMLWAGGMLPLCEDTRVAPLNYPAAEAVRLEASEVEWESPFSRDSRLSPANADE
jgi:hypothetical protein